MAAYCVATATITTPEKMKEYGAHAADALAKYDGKVISKSTSLVALDGTAPTADVCVILEFPDAEKAKAWRADPALEDVHALRNDSGDWTLYLLD